MGASSASVAGSIVSAMSRTRQRLMSFFITIYLLYFQRFRVELQTVQTFDDPAAAVALIEGVPRGGKALLP